MKRNSNVEVLRVVAMFLIVLYHAYSHGIYGYKYADLQDWWTVFFYNLIIWHVDAFVAISGWYGIHLSIKKIGSLYGTILYYAVLGYALWWCFDYPTIGDASVRVSGGWFGGSYLMLMLVAPLLNGAIEGLYNKSRQLLFVAWCFMAVGALIHWGPLRLLLAVNPTGAEGHSFFTLVFVYLTARSARLFFEKPLKKSTLLWTMGLCLACSLVPVVARESSCGLVVAWSGIFVSYLAPTVWGFALAVVMYVVWYPPPAACPAGQWLVRLAPSMFGVYLLHEVCHIGNRGLIMLEKVIDGVVHPGVVVLVAAVLVFGVCVLIDLMRRGSAFYVKKIVNPWLEYLDELPIMREIRRV